MIQKPISKNETRKLRGFFPLEIKHTNNIHHLRAKILKQKLVLIRLKQDTDIKMSVCILIYSNHIIKNQKNHNKKQKINQRCDMK